MGLQTEHYHGGYNQNSYSSYQGPYGSYSNYQRMTEQTIPYSAGYPQISNYSSAHAQQQHSGWSTGGNYHADGGSHYSGGGGFGSPVKPSLADGYGNSHYGSSYTHGSSHGFSHGNQNSHGYGSPPGYGNSHGRSYGNSHGRSYGNSHGYGSGAPNPFNKLTHGHSTYGHSSPNYGHHGAAGGTNQPSWILKGLDDDE